MPNLPSSEQEQDPSGPGARPAGTSIGIGLGIIGLAIFLLALGSGLLSYSSRPLAAVSQEGSYFRLKIGLSHKGEPIDMDIVVGCGVRITESRLTGNSVDIMSMYPFVYAMPISGGHAVLVRTVEISGGGDYRLCRGGTTANGTVPKDWLPVIVWYDRADDLSHGIAYLTQDAYENPNSQLEFHGAVVEPAARSDFDSFMATKPHNLVPAYSADWMCCTHAPFIREVKDITPEIAADPRKAWPFSLHPTCRGVKRLPLTAQQRERVRELWPADHPHIWAPDSDVQQDLRFKMLTDLRSSHENYPSHYDLPGAQSPTWRYPPVYPVSVDYALARMSKEIGGNNPYFLDVLIGDGTTNKGFIYCDSDTPFALEEMITGHRPSAFQRVDAKCRIGDFVVPTKTHMCDGPWWVAFQDDEFAIVAVYEFRI
jgi:hypothetical protein